MGEKDKEYRILKKVPRFMIMNKSAVGENYGDQNRIICRYYHIKRCYSGPGKAIRWFGHTGQMKEVRNA
jgi:hypothetical protein